jgi:hypothetical protein
MTIPGPDEIRAKGLGARFRFCVIATGNFPL